MQRTALFCALTIVCIPSGCSLLPDQPGRSSPAIQRTAWEANDHRTIYVVGHGWHTGLVLKTSDVAAGSFPEIRRFQENRYIELGWGDEGFYRAGRLTAPLVMKAAFWPTPSVVHIAGFTDEIQNFYPASDIVELTVTEDQLDGLCRFAADALSRNPEGKAYALGPGIYGDSTFYRANGSYYMPKTCNVWTAKALRAAGFPVISQTAITAENVIRQSRRLGNPIQQATRGIKRAALSAGD